MSDQSYYDICWDRTIEPEESEQYLEEQDRLCDIEREDRDFYD